MGGKLYFFSKALIYSNINPCGRQNWICRHGYTYLWYPKIHILWLVIRDVDAYHLMRIFTPCIVSAASRPHLVDFGYSCRHFYSGFESIEYFVPISVISFVHLIRRIFRLNIY